MSIASCIVYLPTGAIEYSVGVNDVVKIVEHGATGVTIYTDIVDIKKVTYYNVAYSV